jgi:hypothetical protein
MVKVRAASMEHFEGLLERIGQHGEMRTSVVLSTQYEGRRSSPSPTSSSTPPTPRAGAPPPAATEPRCRVAAAGRVRPGRRRRGTPGRRPRRRTSPGPPAPQDHPGELLGGELRVLQLEQRSPT